MDYLQEWELHLLSEMIPWAKKDEYEMTRLMMWSIMSPYFKKGQSKKPKDILPLPTDRDEVEEYSEEELTDIRQHVANMKIF